MMLWSLAFLNSCYILWRFVLIFPFLSSFFFFFSLPPSFLLSFLFLPLGPQNHQFVTPTSDGSSLESVGMGSVYEKKPVVGDHTAGPVLDCLIYIAQLYGEPVLTYQYLPYIGYLVRREQ